MITISDSPYTQHRQSQYRGPTDSTSYNQRVEENYKDLVVLYNRARIVSEDMREGYARLVKDHMALQQMLEDLEARALAIEASVKRLTFYSGNQIDNTRFSAYSGYAITNPCTMDARHGVLVLPKVDAGGISKLAFVNSDGRVVVPSSLETRVVGVTTSVDSSGAILDSSDPSFAIARTTGRIWERNVVVTAAGASAQLYLYVKVPQDLSSTANSNVLVFHPYPALGCDITDVAYSTKVDAILQDSDGYTTLNSSGLHQGETAAKGFIPPGGWTTGDDAIVNAGAKAFYFDPKAVTAFRVKLRQPNYFYEAGKYIYSYGASHIDLRYDKFETTGKCLIRFDAPAGNTISAITSLQPHVWNVSNAELANVFSYRTIWETSPGGAPTLTPVALSSRVWVEVSLALTAGGGTPVLSGLTITYA